MKHSCQHTSFLRRVAQLAAFCQCLFFLYRIARLEHLMERRPELLSSVMLRQNPHAVHEWHKRVKLFEGNPTRQILTYTEAVKTVDADKVCIQHISLM